MSAGNQSIDFNGKYQYVVTTIWRDEERVYGVYDTLKALKLGINNMYTGFKEIYYIKKIFVKPEIVQITNEEAEEIDEYVGTKKVKVVIN